MIDPDVNLETVGKLLALVAHDLRNPLSAIHSNLGFLNSALVDEPGPTQGNFGDREEEMKDALSDGLISCEGLTHMIDNIETLGQVLRGAPPPSRSAVPVVELVHEAMGRCAPVADSYGIKLERFRTPPGFAQLAVLASRDQAGKALGNLIRNAIQHSSPGQAVSVQVRGPEGAAELQVVVEDEGTPILPATLQTMFTAEGQVRAKAASDGRYSRALGLYVAKLGAELSGGRVHAETATNAASNRLIIAFPTAA